METVTSLWSSFWQWRLEVDSPEFATIVGVHSYNDKLDDMSPEAYESRCAYYATLNEKINQLQFNEGELDPSTLISWNIFKQDIQDYLTGMKHKTYLNAISNLEGPQTNFPTIVSYMPFHTLGDYHTYFKRLEKFPEQIDQIIQLLKKGVTEGRVPPLVCLNNIETQLHSLISSPMDHSPFYKPLKTFPTTVPRNQHPNLEAIGRTLLSEKIFPAYGKLSEFLKMEYIPHARSEIAVTAVPDGENLYKELLKFHTSTNLTPNQIFYIGNQEVTRIKTRMSSVMNSLGFSGSLSSFSSHLKNDPNLYYQKEEDLVNGYRILCKRIDPKLVRLFGTLPRTPYRIKKMSESTAQSAPSAYYLGPSETGDRPGTFFVNTHKLSQRPKYEMAALACHEAVPGHHLQISLTVEMASLPKWRRNIEDRNYYQAPGRSGLHTAYIEGWGLYSEYLGEELGLYKNGYSLFGRYSMEIFRACRLVVDTGMHTMGWTRQQAIDFMSENTALSLHNIEVEVDRYIIMPGQACAYKIGELKLKELRETAAQELGQAFLLREFHDLVLGLGPVPLTLLEEEVWKFIASKKKRLKFSTCSISQAKGNN